MSEATIWEEEQEERFQVTDDQKADWCLRKIAEADAELQKLTDWYERQTALAKEQHDSRVAYFTGLLQEYFSTVPAHETKTMSKYTLPSGELVLTKAKNDFVKADEEKLLSWCVSNDPYLVKVTTAPKWADLKKRLVVVEGKIVDSDTGLFVDGVEIEEKPAEFKVKARGN
jgi:hypothetical protein